MTEGHKRGQLLTSWQPGTSHRKECQYRPVRSIRPSAAHSSLPPSPLRAAQSSSALPPSFHHLPIMLSDYNWDRGLTLMVQCRESGGGGPAQRMRTVHTVAGPPGSRSLLCFPGSINHAHPWSFGTNIRGQNNSESSARCKAEG